MASGRTDLSDALWVRSSYSNGSGGECVEVARDFPSAASWRKSTYSNGDGGDCVEVADGLGVVPVRDSKNPAGPVLVVTGTAWSAFIAGVRAH
ncbi:DUF397 domain-containing protein [Streptomyces sp. NPDC006552]|uniref:DUF397 domain-containing protein n=1 Tax=Streptomyces sp. NPDC006552 TaxID=3157179 RepID=UPI00339E3AB5